LLLHIQNQNQSIFGAAKPRCIIFLVVDDDELLQFKVLLGWQHHAIKKSAISTSGKSIISTAVVLYGFMVLAINIDNPIAFAFSRHIIEEIN
jgi:hypothetical protein